MPRGGVLVAREVARALGAPLHVFVARKLGVPGLEEVAIGAIAEGSSAIVLDGSAEYLGVPSTLVDRIAQRERREVARRAHLYRAGRALPDLRGRTVVLVDDGLASGATLRAAVRALRALGARRLICAVPVASADGSREVEHEADQLLALATPEPFETVSQWYEEFEAVTDEEVLVALGHQSSTYLRPVKRHEGVIKEQNVSIELDADRSLLADVGPPDGCAIGGSTVHGLMIFAHGGGSSRQSYRNRFLAGWLRMNGWSTLRVDLLTEHEQREDAPDGMHRFDVAMIAKRLGTAIDWAVQERVPGAARIMLFGASTGAAAAVVAAADRPSIVAGVLARGGRLDLAGEALTRLRAPLLMIVGARDPLTLRANRDALRAVRGDVDLKLVRGAGHTFEEPGAIGAVGSHVERWLARRSGQLQRPWWRRILQHTF